MLREVCAQFSVQAVNIVEVPTGSGGSESDSVERFVAGYEKEASLGRSISALKLSSRECDLAQPTRSVDERGLDASVGSWVLHQPVEGTGRSVRSGRSSEEVQGSGEQVEGRLVRPANGRSDELECSGPVAADVVAELVVAGIPGCGEALFTVVGGTQGAAGPCAIRWDEGPLVSVG